VKTVLFVLSDDYDGMKISGSEIANIWVVKKINFPAGDHRNVLQKKYSTLFLFFY